MIMVQAIVSIKEINYSAMNSTSELVIRIHCNQQVLLYIFTPKATDKNGKNHQPPSNNEMNEFFLLLCRLERE